VLLAKVRAAEPTGSEVARQGVPLIRAARPLVGKLGGAIGPLTRSTGSIAVATREIPGLTRTAQALAGMALPLLERVRAEDLVAVAARAGRDTPRLMRRLLRVQLETLGTQRESLRTQLATLEIQRRALTHIESIDRKTGGTVPPPVPAGAP
jgi:hypothetical protein